MKGAGGNGKCAFTSSEAFLFQNFEELLTGNDIQIVFLKSGKRGKLKHLIAFPVRQGRKGYIEFPGLGQR